MIRTLLLGLLALAISAMWLGAQQVRGELHLEVHDPQGSGLAPAAELVSNANQFRRTCRVSLYGRYVAQDLPFGLYRLSLNAEGFPAWTGLVEIRSEIPVRLAIALGVAPVTTHVEVTHRVVAAPTFQEIKIPGCFMQP